MDGFLISLEGVHGAGKSTVLAYVRDQLKKESLSAVFSRDQAGTPFSETIRNLNLDAIGAVDLYTETFLVAAARRQTYVDVILPSLKENQTVITERFIDSFFAYGAARSLRPDITQVIAESTCGGRYPDLTLLLDLPPELGLQRIPENAKHRIEKEDILFHQRLREGYLIRARENSNHTIVIDAARAVENVTHDAWNAIHSALPR
jgi:dTMP kinase